MTEVIEFIEKLEVPEATNKQPSTKENDKDESEDQTGKSKIKTKKFHKKNSKFKQKKKNEYDFDFDSDSDSDDAMNPQELPLCQVTQKSEKKESS